VSPTIANNTAFDLIGKQMRGMTAKISFFVMYSDPPSTTDNETTSTDNITSSFTNTAPSFESALLSEITVEVTKFLNGSLSNSSYFVYQSPKAIDPENDTISMSFYGV
jgi:hypothetical protein